MQLFCFAVPKTSQYPPAPGTVLIRLSGSPHWRYAYTSALTLQFRDSPRKCAPSAAEEVKLFCRPVGHPDGKQRSAAEFEIGHHSPRVAKFHFRLKGLNLRTPCWQAERLENRHRIQRVLESCLQKSRAVRPGKDPSIVTRRSTLRWEVPPARCAPPVRSEFRGPVFHPDCAQLSEEHASSSIPNNFLMKISTPGNER